MVIFSNVKRLRFWLYSALTLGLFPLCARATTIVPPDFDSLVSQADYVVRGVVKSTISEWRSDSSGKHIISKVTIQVTEIIKGQPPSPLVLQTLGGTIGRTRMVVEGAPSFLVGDDNVLFIHGNGTQFIPVVALSYGQFLVTRDAATGQELVHRSNGSALYDVKDVARPMTAATAATSTGPRPLTMSEFSIHIRQSAARRVNNPSANAN
jgi:hypothetical protein